MPTEIDHIITLLERTFEANAWHGPSVKEAIQGMTEAESHTRLPNTHSIIELVGHMAAWRKYVVRKVLGDSSYTVSDEANFPSGKNWAEIAQHLKESQEELVNVLRQFPLQDIFSQVAGVTQPLTYYTLLHGIIQHDLYHAGQIVLIRKSKPGTNDLTE